MFQLEYFTDYSLIAMRLMVGLVFIDSGFLDLRNPAARAKSIGVPERFGILLGIAELLGGVAVIIGGFQQLAAIGLIAIMLGAIQKKMVAWKTGFWGKNALGWHYELILVSMLLVILSTNGGRFVLLR